jgi:hypothetical protein
VIDQEPHVSDLGWDQWLAGDLPAEQRERARIHAASCGPCAARLHELTAARDAFVSRPLPARVRPVRHRARVLGGVAAIAVAATVLAVVRIAPAPEQRTKGTPGTTGTTGSNGPELVLAAGRPGALAQLASDDAIHPGDYLQAGYSSPRDGFGAVISLDGAGATTVYVPSRGDATVALPAGSERSFPESTVLDQVVGTERIWLLWGEAAHPLAPLVAQLRSTGQLTAPAGCHVRAVTLDKRAGR